jgi:hypothetical protein
MTTIDDNHTTDAALGRAVEVHRHRSEQLEALWAMTPTERQQAMWRGELSFFQLCEWSARAPHEIPRIPTDLTPAGEPGEFAWIVMHTPEWAEANG